MAWIATSPPTLTENQPVNCIVLWDCSSDPPGHSELVYRWNGYAENDSVHSLLRYVETHGERLRSKYLAWIHDLGESQIEGKRIIDRLALENGLSYWWMTLLVEQNPWKSPSIINAIRLFALEEIVVRNKPGKLRLVSANRWLHKTVRGLCHSLEIDYEWERPLWPLRFKGLNYVLPQPVRALISLARHLHARWPLRRMGRAGWFDDDRALFFCSYFFHLDCGLAKNGQFYSRYWEGLHGLLQENSLHGNWLQLYIPHDEMPNSRIAIDWAQRFNQQRHEQGFHTFLDTYLSWQIVLRVLKHWFYLNLISWHLREIKKVFLPTGSRFSLWTLMRGDWYASMRGPVAIDNLLWIELFDTALHELPHQKKGLYLCENKAWERALVHAWRKQGHGQLIAVPHSTIRFWHLSYFTDPRTLRSSGSYPIPQADIFALNGKMAVDAYLGMDYPKGAIMECEALRYNYLGNFQSGHSLRRRKSQTVNVLIVGDYMPSGTIKMLELLEAAAPHVSAQTTYTAKPHPSFMIREADYPSLHLKVVTRPLKEILFDFDIAYASSMTSAAVDAYLAGLPVVVMLDEMELNFSPLRGQPNVSFVSTAKELAAALQNAGRTSVAKPNGGSFFFLDPELPRWKRLLEIA